MTPFAFALILGAVALLVYSYFGYPLLLLALARLRGRRPIRAEPGEWPMISISIPVYNEAHQIRDLLESILALDYPPERRQIVVISDASTDGTDDIVREYASRGVELLRQPERRGKTAAENAAHPVLRGEIVVNTDASIRIDPDALKPLIAAFADPTVGVASGRDVSVTRAERDSNGGEGGYVGYEMWLRGLETRVEGIVGASGCFYAIRSHLHRQPLPEGYSRDFASALIAREHGYRAVSVDEAVCYVPRTPSLRREYRRKVRTFSRGMQTLAHKRHLLNPFRYGLFAWMLFSHKVCRWLVPWGAVAALGGVVLLAFATPWGWAPLAAAAVGGALAWMGWSRPEGSDVPRILAIPAFIAAGNIAVLKATINALRGSNDAIWEPTRRETAAAPAPAPAMGGSGR
jgi:cellulose synthase/poly-beta-1,6-N-acetylglucosamine synthase-like glycosyltransferase